MPGSPPHAVKKAGQPGSGRKGIKRVEQRAVPGIEIGRKRADHDDDLQPDQQIQNRAGLFSINCLGMKKSLINGTF